MIFNESNRLRYTVDFFKSHIPTCTEIDSIAEEKYKMTHYTTLYDILEVATDSYKESCIYHVDTFLRDDKTWRVQIKIKFPLVNNGQQELYYASKIFSAGMVDSILSDVFFEGGGVIYICKLITFDLPYDETKIE